MVGYLIFIIFFAIGFWWYLSYQDRKLDIEYEMMREHLRALRSNAEMNEAFESFFATEYVVEPAVEPAKPVEESSPADLILATVEEDKWQS